MAISKEQKEEIIARYRLHDKDTGSPEVQIAILSEDITTLTEHLKMHRKDFHSQRGMMKKIGQRRKLLDYLKDRDIESYRHLIDQLHIRR